MICVVARRGSQVLLSQALLIGTGLLAAGTWRWPRLWIWVAVSLAMIVAIMIYVLPRNPAVIEARSHVGANTKTFDKVFALLYGLGQLGMMVVCGFDAVRFGWTSVPSWVSWAGLLVLVVGFVPIAWAMGENPHLETTVRVQTDRAHRVITTGPYAIVRHPMYVGACLQHLATPLALGSVWGLLVSVGLVAALVVRTYLEDRTLHAELPGYAEYATRTRHRLLPGVW